jgi:uncharacterized protein (TIGR02453 family)
MTEFTGASLFEGFPRETFTWFGGLEADNSKAYFTAHRGTYEEVVRGALQAMLDELADELGGHVKMFRQNRDVRFSADKSPYKTTTYGLIVERPNGDAALYAQLSAAGLFCGSGYHVLSAEQLSRFREAIAADTTGSELEQAIAIAEAASLEIFGAELKVGPRGYPRDHPRAGLLRHKSLFAGRRLGSGANGITRDAALIHTRASWAACSPLNAWLDDHVGTT